MSIKSEILAWQGTDEDLILHLNDRSITLTDNTFYTSRQLVNVLGAAAYRLVSATLAQAQASDPLLTDMFLTLRTTGRNFADPLTQGMIDLLGSAANWPEAVITSLKEIGIKIRSIAELELGRPAVQADISAARLEIWKAETVQRGHQAAALFAESVRSAQTIWNQEVQEQELISCLEQVQ